MPWIGSIGAITAALEARGYTVHSIALDEDPEADKKASYFGNSNENMDKVCMKVKELPEFSGHKKINAIGFSQGGLFLRAFVERCNDPQVHNLITFGAPHQGKIDIVGVGNIDEFEAGIAYPPQCKDVDSTYCNMMAWLFRNGAYSSMVQNRVVRARAIFLTNC